MGKRLITRCYCYLNSFATKDLMRCNTCGCIMMIIAGWVILSVIYWFKGIK